MTKFFLSILLMLNLLQPEIYAQSCEITSVNATVLPCMGNNFNVSINLEVSNPSSPGFTLAGNGVIYGTYLYSDLPVTVGPLLGDSESNYEFIAWDVENADCQQFTTLSAANCGPICSISNFVLEFLGCVSNQSALVVFDFDTLNPSGLTFDLLNEQGDELGTWLYSSLPVTLPFFEVNGAAPIVLTVCDHTNPDCCETFVLDAIDCNPNNCEIFSVTADPECTGNNFVVHLNFGFDNPPSDSFMVAGNTINYGTFGYNELPITLGPLNGSSNIDWVFGIMDSELGTCSASATLGIYNCPPPCNFQALNATALLCNGNEAYSLLLEAVIEGEGDNGFAVFSESAYYGSYSYDELPLTILAFEGSGEFVDIVSVCDNENLGCCATIPFEALLCAGCLIYNITATPLPCNSEDQIFVEINFNHQNVSTEGFEITGNGNNYGSFLYEDLPVQVGPFAGDGSEFFEFVITDLVDPFCFGAIELGFINCNEICELSNLVVETGVCTGNNSYTLHVDFDYQGTTGIGFDLFANGEFYDAYSYNDLPLTIEEFPSNGTGLDTVKVCENDNPQCCATLSFDSPNCACNIFDINVENLGCSSDTTFDVSLEFFYENLPGNSVDVFLDGFFIGFYNVEDIPFTISIPEGTGFVLLSVCANEANNCCDELFVDLMNCDSPECSIFDLLAETGDCNSDSTFLLDIVFEHNNLPIDSVNISANNQFIGKYKVQPDFIRIEHFPVLAGDTTTLTVCAVGDPNCCDTYSFATPDCSLFGQCIISNLVAEPGDCNSDSTYVLHIDFNSQNLPSDTVIITGNGNYIGQFYVNPENITIDEFPLFDTNYTVITVCALGNEECCASYTFETPNCEGEGPCQIDDLIATIGDCLSDSTYLLFVDYFSFNLTSDSVTVTANDQFIGHFLHNPDGFLIENFPIFDTNLTVITLCSVGNEECCDTYEFDTPSCENGGTCQLYDLVADPVECHGDSTYTLFLHYVGVNLHADSVVVSTNEGFMGHYVHNPAGFTIENFPAYTTSHTVVTVCSLGNGDCCDVYEFDTPDCGQEFVCEIYDLFAETGQCTSDSTFVLDVVFQSDNTPFDSVLIYANDQFVGQFFNDPEFIHIENFPHLTGEQTTVTVCALGAPDCCDTYSFETPFCTDTCTIYNIEVNVFDCNTDSTFGAVIHFEYQNISAGGFDVYTGDTYLGFFTIEQVPIEISNFPANESGVYVVTICESDTTACCASQTFEGPVCGSVDCQISNLQYSLTPCDEEGNFYFILDFDFQNISNEGFQVAGNGNNYGNFEYDNVPVQIGPFQSGDTEYEFIVSDIAHPDCFASIFPGVVNCFVATTPVDFDQYFQVFNNGTIPGILAKKNIKLSVFHSNGKMVMDHFPVSTDELFELKTQPAGFYIGFIQYGEQRWSVKLVKSGN